MPSNKENTNPKALQAAQNSKSKGSSSTAYGHTPAVLGLHGWHPPQAHMFVSPPASVSSFPAITHPSRANTSSTNAIGLNRPIVGSSETRLSNRTSASPLKVRKTRENLRTGFVDDAASTREHPVHDFAQREPTSVQPLREIQNTVYDEAPRPSSNDRFSWESDSFHLTTVIERSPTKHTSSQSEKNVSKSAPSLSRKLSVRKRVVSRVREGLLNRSKSSSRVPVKNDDNIAISRSASEHERFAQIMPGDHSEDLEGSVSAEHTLASDSVQSLVSTDSPLGDIGPTTDILPPFTIGIKSFLPGSDGSYPSPSEEAKPRSSPSPEKTPRPRTFAQLSQIHVETISKPLSMLHVNLSVMPACETMDLADDATMWAMIKAEASVSSGSSTTGSISDMRRSACPEHIAKTQKPLTLIVIIDNSLFASPLALHNISEFTRCLCSLLRDHRDRLAVFCTSCSHESQCSDTKSGCQLHALQKPDASLLSNQVAKLGSSKATSQYSAARLSDMIQEALASVIDIEEDLDVTLTHAIVLSPLPHRCASILREYVSWPIHQVQVGYAYEPPSREQVTTGGWCFAWEEAPDTILQALVQSARETSHFQELSHVRVSINSTEPCRVEKLLTPPRKATLHPGQCTTLFAKVRIPAVDHQRSPDPASVDGLLDELHKTLGMVKSELFKADVRYRHSLLPRDTELRTEQACELIRTNRNSQWGATHEEEDKGRVDVEIEKAKFAARNYPPDVAIRILHKKFGKSWSGNDGPPVLRRLREELEFQKEVSMEMSKVVVQSSTTATQHQDSKSTHRTTLHFADTEALQVFNTAPSTPTPEEGNPNIEMSTAEHHSDGQRLDSLVIQDEARRIWRHMRRNSRTTSGISSPPDASSRACSGAPQQEHTLLRRGSQESIVDRMAAADTRINDIRLKAIQNKRSVGAETLREFSMMHQQDKGGSNDLRDEACMPWL